MLVRNQSISEQVRNQILQWIRSDRADLENGVLPSETELSELFGTSRSTVREALAQLERDRIIVRRQGAGTFINSALRRLSSTLNDLIDPTRLIELQGFEAAIAWCDMVLEEAEKALCDALGLDAGAPILHARAVYSADQQPAIWLDALIPIDPLRPPGKFFPDISNLFQFSAEISGRAATHSVATLQPVAADELLQAHLQVEPGEPLLALEENYLTDYGRPVFWGRTVYAPKFIQLQVLRNSHRTSERISIW